MNAFFDMLQSLAGLLVFFSLVGGLGYFIDALFGSMRQDRIDRVEDRICGRLRDIEHRLRELENGKDDDDENDEEDGE